MRRTPRGAETYDQWKTRSDRDATEGNIDMPEDKPVFTEAEMVFNVAHAVEEMRNSCEIIARKVKINASSVEGQETAAHIERAIFALKRRE